MSAPERPPAEELLTPWHYAVLPNDGPGGQGMLEHRLRTSNPAVLAVLERHDTTWELAIAELVEQEATDDEIWAGDWLKLLPFRLRRYLVALLAEQRQPHPLTRDEILAERAADLAAGGRGGELAVAKRLNSTESTVYRWRKRHGLIPWPKD